MGGQKPNFLRKYLVLARRFAQKPGFFDLCANSRVRRFDNSGELQLFKNRRTITLCFPRIATKI